MRDKLFKVSWPSGHILVHNRDEQGAIATAIKFLADPCAHRVTAKEVVWELPEFKENADAVERSDGQVEGGNS